MLRWYRTEKNEKRPGGGLGTIIFGAFGKTALPAINVFPFGIFSKPIRNKMCVTSSSGRDGDHVILGYNFKDTEEILNDGELMLFSTNDEEVKQATIKLHSKEEKGTIEITAANKGEKTAKMTLLLDGNVELFSTDNEGKRQANITLENDGNIKIKTGDEEKEISNITVLSDGNLVLSSNNVNDEEMAKITLENNGSLEMNAKNGDKITSKMSLQSDGSFVLSSTNEQGEARATITLEKNGGIKISASKVELDTKNISISGNKGKIEILDGDKLKISGKGDSIVI